MANNPTRCESCGRELDPSEGTHDARAPASLYETPPTAIAESNLQRQVELLDKVSYQLNELTELVRLGSINGQQVLGELESLKKRLQPMHGLCISRDCVLCRQQELAIKEHVLLYIDWKVPGTVAKLQQAQTQQLPPVPP
jgi:hypothetical protein